jgi:hypothetical protein
LSYDPLDILVSNVVKDFPAQEYNGQFQEVFVQESYQQVQENVVAPEYYEVHVVHDLFQAGQEGHSLVNGA